MSKIYYIPVHHQKGRAPFFLESAFLLILLELINILLFPLLLSTTSFILLYLRILYARRSAYSEQGIHTFIVFPLSSTYFRRGFIFLLQIVHFAPKKENIDTLLLILTWERGSG